MMVRWSGEVQVSVRWMSGERQISIWAWHWWTWNLSQLKSNFHIISTSLALSQKDSFCAFLDPNGIFLQERSLLLLLSSCGYPWDAFSCCQNLRMSYCIQHTFVTSRLIFSTFHGLFWHELWLFARIGSSCHRFYKMRTFGHDFPCACLNDVSPHSFCHIDNIYESYSQDCDFFSCDNTKFSCSWTSDAWYQEIKIKSSSLELHFWYHFDLKNAIRINVLSVSYGGP